MFTAATAIVDSSFLREQLMAPSPMPRVMALHALEGIELKQGDSPSRVALAQAAAKFVERGIPFYSAHSPDYQAWVSKAVSYWERLNAASC